MSEKHAYTCPYSQELVRDLSAFKMVPVGEAEFYLYFLRVFTWPWEQNRHDGLTGEKHMHLFNMVSSNYELS